MMSNTVKSFDILVINFSVLHNYFDRKLKENNYIYIYTYI